MTRTRYLVVVCALAAFAAPALSQQDLRATLFADADKALADARAVDAELLAPDTMIRGLEVYMSAEADLTRGRNIERIRGALASATKTFTEARDAAEIASVTLAAVIKTRADGTNDNAATFAAEL